MRFPCVHAAATTPVWRMGSASLKLPHPYQPSPEVRPGRPTHRRFRGLLSVHSRCGLHTRTVTYVTVIRGLQTFRHLHACPGCFRLEHSRVGLSPTGKRRLGTAHGLCCHSDVTCPAASSSPIPDTERWWEVRCGAKCSQLGRYSDYRTRKVATAEQTIASPPSHAKAPPMLAPPNLTSDTASGLVNWPRKKQALHIPMTRPRC